MSLTHLLLCVCFFPLQAAGAALAYVGSYVIKSYNSFEDFVSDKYSVIPAAIIIGVAVVMFVIGIVGCCATLRESKVGLGFVSMGHLSVYLLCPKALFQFI